MEMPFVRGPGIVLDDLHVGHPSVKNRHLLPDSTGLSHRRLPLTRVFG
jgi:hypothetical protein